MSFDLAFTHTVGIEGGYSDHPSDRGGATKYGITERVARAEGYQGDMRDLPMLTAKIIYKRRYWDLLNLTAIDLIASPIAHELFDTGVNMGTSIAGVFFQRCLNALNRNGQDYADLLVDGVIGAKSIEAFQRFYVKRGMNGIKVLLRLLNGLQLARYVDICERDRTQEAFLYGWANNRVTI